MRSTFCGKGLHHLFFLIQNFRLRIIGINVFGEIIKKSDNEYQFNPSTIFTGNKYFTIWREVDKSRTRHLFLRVAHVNDRESELHDLGEQIKAMNSSVKWIGDARLFTYGGKLQLVFDTGHSETPNRIFITVLDINKVSVTSVKEVKKLDGRKEIEKNWNFFEEGQNLFAIYTHQPFTIIELAKETEEFLYFRTVITHFYKSNSNSKIRGEIRGTSTPILVGNLFISLTHSSFITKKGFVYQSHYFVFGSTYPFLPVSLSIKPINYGIVGKILRPSVKLNQSVHQVEFPSGAFKAGKNLILGFGLNDFKVGVKVIKLSKILSQRSSIEIEL